MPFIHEELIIPYSQKQVFNLISDFENYSKFLPWCSESKILKEVDGKYYQQLKLVKSGFEKTFIISVSSNFPSNLKMDLIEGPFKEFSGICDLNKINQEKIKLSFDLKFSFDNLFLNAMGEKLFEQVAKDFVEGFYRQAKEVYGNND